MSREDPARRREIEDSTAARLAEIVTAAERAARQVIDEAEEEARVRLSDADEKADRIVAERLAGLIEFTDEIDSQVEALGNQVGLLKDALAQAKAQKGGPESRGGSANGRGEPELPDRRSASPSPSLTVVGGAGEEEPGPGGPSPEVEVAPGSDPELPSAIGGTSAGARLLATQMAVSGSSRDEIEARLRNGFAITDTRAILDAILGPEQ